MDDYDHGYADGYLTAIQQVQDYLVDELDWINSGVGSPVPTTYYISELIANLDGWMNDWMVSNV